MRNTVPLLILLALMSIHGCSTPLVNKGNTPHLSCTHDRPQLCAMQYEPVCATLKNTTERSYSSACAACSAEGTRSYTLGTCE